LDLPDAGSEGSGMTTSTPPEAQTNGEGEWSFRTHGPRRRTVRAVIMLLGILLPQCLLYWPSLSGRKIALPVDLMYELSPDSRGAPPNLNPVLWDPTAQYEPTRQFVAAELRAGR